jgi:uncharacterized protein YggE
MKTLVLAAFAGVVAIGGSQGAEMDKQITPSVTVVGSGEVSAKPDQAQIDLGVVTANPTAAKALQENTEAMQKLFKRLSGLGIAEKDIQTSNFSVTPQHKRGPQGQYEPGIVGYEVTNTVHITVRDMSKVGGVLDDLVTEGANTVHGIQFSVAEPNPLLDEARKKAVADARHKAELYTTAAGVNVGRVLLIQEETPRMPQPLMFGAAPAAAARAVPVAPGELKFHASITITYALP